MIISENIIFINWEKLI